MRAAALARAAEKRGHRARILASSRQARGLPIDATWLPTSERTKLVASVRAAVLGQRWDVLVIDTFPRGLLGELAPLLPRLACPKVLVHRDVSPAYWQRFSLEAFVQHYDLVLLPGEAGPLRRHRNLAATEPWLIRDSHELLAREAARLRLGVAAEDERPLVLVSASGTDAEMSAAGRLASRLACRLPSAVVKLAAPSGNGHLVWPLLEVLPGVDVLVGAGGYNTVNEARCTSTPIAALPRARLYDRQARRLNPDERVRDERELLERVEALLASVGRRRAPAYRNGTHEAVRRIEELTPGRSQLSPPPTS